MIERNEGIGYVEERVQQFFNREMFIVGKAYRIIRNGCAIEGLLSCVGGSYDEKFPTSLAFVVLDHEHSFTLDTRPVIVHIDDMYDETSEKHTEIYELEKGMRVL